MTDHGIIAPDWQIQAAADGNLGAIILPFPDVQETTNTWFLKWGGIDRFWGKGEMPGQSVYDAIDYQVCDRLFFQEEWCKGDWGAAFDDDIYFTKSTTPEAENIGWQPAYTMPKEAAQHWYEVTGFRVMQMGEIDRGLCCDAGLIDKQLNLSCGIDSISKQWASIFLRWNEALPNHFWDSDRWVVALNAKVLENNNA
jgi:hypothetical protein